MSTSQKGLISLLSTPELALEVNNETYDFRTLVSEIDPRYRDYHMAERILQESTLTLKELSRYPHPDKLDEYNRVRDLMEEELPVLAKQLFGKFKRNKRFKRMSTEQSINRYIEDLEPKWELVNRQDDESVWSREWTDTENNIFKDYVVWSDYASPPGWVAFSIENGAFRFKTLNEALTFIRKRNIFALATVPCSKCENDHLVADMSIPEGRRIIRINKEDISDVIYRTLTASAEPNCEIKNHYLKSLRKIEYGEHLTIAVKKKDTNDA